MSHFLTQGRFQEAKTDRQRKERRRGYTNDGREGKGMRERQRQTKKLRTQAKEDLSSKRK